MNIENIIGICIPTYNRGDWLDKNIRNLIDILGMYKISIYISDNGSIDNTTEIVGTLKKAYPYIHYSRNEENLGYDRNAAKVLNMCNAEYAWLLGDDDTIYGEVEILIERIKEITPACILLDYAETTSKKYGIYSDKNELLNDLFSELTFCSGIIISRDILQNVDMSRYFDTWYVHTFTILDFFARHPEQRLLFVKNTFIKKMRPEYCGFSESWFDLRVRGLTEGLMRLPGFSYTDKLKWCKMNCRKFPIDTKSLISLRAEEKFDMKILKNYWPYMKLYTKKSWINLMLIAIFPAKLVKFVKNVYKKAKGGNRLYE